MSGNSDFTVSISVARVMARDGVPETQARAILAAQASREQRLGRTLEELAADGNAIPVADLVTDDVVFLNARYQDAG